MENKSTIGAKKKKRQATVVTSLSIERQTMVFLEAGGKVEYINSGVSGDPRMVGRKHIILGNSPKSN